MMNLLFPQFSFDKVYDIPISFFEELGINCVVLDVDNTITRDNSQDIIEPVSLWLKEIQKQFRVFILSNNHESRVRPFAEKIDVDYIFDAKKPSAKKLKRQLKKLGVTSRETVLIGDQIFTDILCANLYGCTSVLVKPFNMENYGFYRVKRFFEVFVIKSYEKRRKKL